jgi:hypothetical protein
MPVPPLQSVKAKRKASNLSPSQKVLLQKRVATGKQGSK